tara:strand:+ start:309 stop:548 length:240 start_codon:yes stop_codon:yes gene_type:complete
MPGTDSVTEKVSAESETARLVNALRAAGLSYHQIGEGIGVHWRTVLRWSRQENRPWSIIAVNRILTTMLAEKAAEPPSA